MGLFCSDCSRKGGFCFNGFSDILGPVQKSLDVCVHTAKWAFTSRHWQFINWDPRHFLLWVLRRHCFDPSIFISQPPFSSNPKKRDLRFSERKNVLLPPKWLFVSDFLKVDFLRSKNLAWWPLTSDPPKALLLEKPSALNKERGGENHWMCSPPSVAHTLLCGKAIGATTLDPRAPTPKNAQHGFFLSFFLCLHQAMGPPSTQNTPTKRHVLFFCPTHKKKGYQPFREKRNKEGKKRMII